MKALKVLVLICAATLLFGCPASNRRDTKKNIDLGKYDQTSDFTGTLPTETQPGDDEGFVGVSTLGKKTSYGDAVIVVATNKIALGRTANDKHMKAFQTSLDSAYLAAQKMYKPLGFTYSISPVGAINPLSDIEVQCVLSEESAQDVGQQTCSLFFAKVKEEYSVNSVDIK